MRSFVGGFRLLCKMRGIDRQEIWFKVAQAGMYTTRPPNLEAEIKSGLYSIVPENRRRAIALQAFCGI